MDIVRYKLEDGQECRVLPITDRHIYEKDLKTVGNYVKVQHKITKDIVEFIRNDKYKNVAVHLGDVAHQGYRSFVSGYRDIMAEMRIAKAVHGDNYIVVGNHMYIMRDSNPEFLMMQPTPKFTTKHEMYLEPDDSILKLHDGIIIGDTQFSFIHYELRDKNYKRIREPGIKTHIAFFHDDNIIPSSIKAGHGMTTVNSSEYIADVLEDIDIAVVPHWHTKVGLVYVHVGNKTVPMYIPGALCHTSVAMSERHKNVELPTFIVSNEGVKIELVTFSTYLNELKFYESNDSDIEKRKRKAARDASIKQVKMKTAEDIGYEFDTIEFLKNSESGMYSVKLYDKACSGTLTMLDAIKYTVEDFK